jgi:hypothetical protein
MSSTGEGFLKVTFKKFRGAGETPRLLQQEYLLGWANLLGYL